MAFVFRSMALGLLALLLGTDESGAATWSYDGRNGPHYWHELFPQACSGKYQSPIDIRPSNTKYDPSLNDFAIWYDPPRPGSTLILSNNGHTVQAVTKGEFYVANGGLPNVYKTTQFHFHWGHAKHHGSEHLVDSQAFPLELHIVSYNSDLYSSLSQAVTEKQGLAILAVLFQMSEEDNRDLEPIIKATEHIKDPEAFKQVDIQAMSLRKLLPRDSSRYYRYNGSLTTPGCFESVVWTVFAQPNSISNRQMNKFRQLLQPRHRRGGHPHYRTRRAASGGEWTSYDVMPVQPREKRRERHALKALDELALSPNDMARFRRELIKQRKQADRVLARIDEHNAGETHRRMLEAVHQPPARQEKRVPDGQDLSELEIELVQEQLTNNFRPVQPLNDRPVHRSFKEAPTKMASSVHTHGGGTHGNEATDQGYMNGGLDGVASAVDVGLSVYWVMMVFCCVVIFVF